MYVTNPSNFGFILTSFGLHDIFYKFSITCNGKMANVTYLLFSSCLFYIWWTSVLTKIICISVKIDWKWYEICTKFSTWYNVESIIFMNVRLDMVLIGRKVKYRSIHLRRHAFGAVLHQSIWRCRTSRKPILLAIRSLNTVKVCETNQASCVHCGAQLTIPNSFALQPRDGLQLV